MVVVDDNGSWSGFFEYEFVNSNEEFIICSDDDDDDFSNNGEEFFDSFVKLEYHDPEDSGVLSRLNEAAGQEEMKEKKRGMGGTGSISCIDLKQDENMMNMVIAATVILGLFSFSNFGIPVFLSSLVFLAYLALFF